MCPSKTHWTYTKSTFDTLQVLVTCTHVGAPTLTCDGEVGEDEEAAAAEADGTVRGSQRRQEQEAVGQFTNTQRCGSFHHTFHGFNTTIRTHG